jgi:2'-5' RNA ligase
MSSDVLSSIWLVPSEENMKQFQMVIDGLAAKYDSTSYIPHITIWGAITAPLSVIEEASRKAIEGIRPFTIDVEKIDYSEEWSKTLFAQLVMNSYLEKISNSLSQSLSKYTHYELNPHLSLVYKEEMTEAEKQKEIPSIILPKSFLVDKIAVTLPQDPINKWKNISKWNTSLSFSFK